MVGVDEVGRGSLAGPLLVVAARAVGKLPPDVKDSKLLSKKQRIIVLERLNSCCEFGAGWVHASEIDKYGLSRGLRLGVKRALVSLGLEIEEEIIMDGKVNYLPAKYKNGRCQVNADVDIPTVSAASIFAKVHRDEFMAKLATKHPDYKFEHNVGYGTAEHLKALAEYGALSSIHRKSYAPVAEVAS